MLLPLPDRTADVCRRSDRCCKPLKLADEAWYCLCRPDAAHSHRRDLPAADSLLVSLNAVDLISEKMSFGFTPATIVTFFGNTTEDIPTNLTKLHSFSDEANGEIVKVSGEYLVLLTVDKMWKYRKRWKFRYPSASGNILFISILISGRKQHKGNLKTGKWFIPTFTMENSFNAGWHLPTFSPCLPDVFMLKRKGIISMITFSRYCRGRNDIFSVHAVERQANEAAHCTARHFRFLSCLVAYDVSPFIIVFCIIAFCNVLILMIDLFSRSGDGNALTRP